MASFLQKPKINCAIGARKRDRLLDESYRAAA
jgi:hypothetical protein